MTTIAVSEFVIGCAVFVWLLTIVGPRCLTFAFLESPGFDVVTPKDRLHLLLSAGWIIAAAAVLIASRDRRIRVWQKAIATAPSFCALIGAIVFGGLEVRATEFWRQSSAHYEAAIQYSPKRHPQLAEDPTSVARLRYHSSLADKYGKAYMRPWLPVAPDPPEPK